MEDLHDETIETALQIENPAKRARRLTDLAESAHFERTEELITAAVRAARQIEDMDTRAAALERLYKIIERERFRAQRERDAA
ncbi:hypothetical protein MXD59_12640 [Frankia sp. Ag45/Mut15]|uniref:UVR domain-containing protein n=1 Tax=Frankia umida TaxID=573489 RepID=A0ABT0JYI9_9ACTN|nr:hypothetical protein [Frankia umida]MCK9876615.1 hypothetical protein [Frankia umida]